MTPAAEVQQRDALALQMKECGWLQTVEKGKNAALPLEHPGGQSCRPFHMSPVRPTFGSTEP